MSILKFRIGEIGTTISDMEYVASSDDSNTNVRGICTDGVHVFRIWDNKVQRYLCSDLSFVDEIATFNGADVFGDPIAITTNGTNIYVTDLLGFGGRVVIFKNSDMSYVTEFITHVSMRAQGIDNDGVKLYIARKPVVT